MRERERGREREGGREREAQAEDQQLVAVRGADLLIGGGASLPVTSTGMSSYLSKFIPAAIVANILSSSSGGAGGT